MISIIVISIANIIYHPHNSKSYAVTRAHQLDYLLLVSGCFRDMQEQNQQRNKHRALGLNCMTTFFDSRFGDSRSWSRRRTWRWWRSGRSGTRQPSGLGFESAHDRRYHALFPSFIDSITRQCLWINRFTTVLSLRKYHFDICIILFQFGSNVFKW